MFAPLFAASDLTPFPARQAPWQDGWQWAGNETLLTLAAVTALILLIALMVWLHHRLKHRSRPPDQRTERHRDREPPPGADPATRRPSGSRRRRFPTLAERGGLPPLRSESESSERTG